MVLFLLFMTGLFAGIIDAIAGGGGLISVPVLFGLGMPPHLVLGTNKLQGVIGTFVAALKYHKHGLISKKTLTIGIIFGLLGSALGSVVSQWVSSDILRTIVPVLLMLVLAYSLFAPKRADQDQAPRMKEPVFYLVFGLLLGFYDGFFGPATGSFWVFAITFFLGYPLMKATAYTKVLNFNSALIATVCFAIGGNIDYKIALCMACGQLIGSRIGAHLAITKGARLIRPLFLSVVSLTIASLFYKSYANSDLFTYLTQEYGIIAQCAAVFALLMMVGMVYLRKSRKMKGYDA